LVGIVPQTRPLDCLCYIRLKSCAARRAMLYPRHCCILTGTSNMVTDHISIRTSFTMPQRMYTTASVRWMSITAETFKAKAKTLLIITTWKPTTASTSLHQTRTSDGHSVVNARGTKNIRDRGAQYCIAVNGSALKTVRLRSSSMSTRRPHSQRDATTWHVNPAMLKLNSFVTAIVTPN